MSDWTILEWIGAVAGIAAVIGTGFAGGALLRQMRGATIETYASPQNSEVAQVVKSPHSTVLTHSPSSLVVQGDLNVTSGYAVDEHERIVKQRVAETRVDLERGHEAEADALRAQIEALTEPEWDRDILNAVNDALNAKQYDRAQELMAEMEESHLAAEAIPAAKKQVQIRQFRAAIARVNGDARTASAHLEVAAGIIASEDPESVPEFRNAAAMHLQDYAARAGGNGIVEAMRLYRINLGQLNRETHPEAWGETQFNLGNALLLHGTRAEDGLHLLAEAIAAFQAALQVCTRTAHPGDWAET